MFKQIIQAAEEIAPTLSEEEKMRVVQTTLDALITGLFHEDRLNAVFIIEPAPMGVKSTITTNMSKGLLTGILRESLDEIAEQPNQVAH